MKVIDQVAINEIFSEIIEYDHSIYPIYKAWKNQAVLFALKDRLTMKLNS